MGEKKDIRSERSKYFIRKSMIELLERKSLEELSVSEIAELAEVSRRTFYIYYESKKDCLMSILTEAMKDILGSDLKKAEYMNWSSVLVSRIEKIRENASVLRAMFRDINNSEWMQLIRYQYDAVMGDYWRAIAEKEKASEDEFELIKRMDCVQIGLFLNYFINQNPGHTLDGMKRLLHLQKARREEWENVILGEKIETAKKEEV